MKTLQLGALVSLSAILAWVLALPHIVMILFAVQVLDVISGLSVATQKRSLRSAIMDIGIRKKTFAWIIVLLVGLLQFELSDYMPTNIILNYSPLEVAALGFVMVEALSIVENGEKLGMPMPAWLKRGLAVAQEDADTGGE